LSLYELLRWLQNHVINLLKLVLDLAFIHVPNEVGSHLFDASHDFPKVKLLFSLLDKEILRQSIIYYVVIKRRLLRLWWGRLQILHRVSEIIIIHAHHGFLAHSEFFSLVVLVSSH
jgi:hypothetical protein